MCSVFLPYFKLIAINIDSDKWHICCFTCMNMHIYIKQQNILSILFQVQFWGCHGKQKFQFHSLCGWRTLYI